MISLNEVKIMEVLRLNGVEVDQVERGTGYYKIKCPLPHHQDSTPSFTVYEETNSFFCFGCQMSGGPVDLHRMLKGFASNKEAEEDLVKNFNIDYNAIPTVEQFSELKGLDLNTLIALGWENVETGIKIPYYGILPEENTEDGVTYRIRRKYSSKGDGPKYVKDGKKINIPYGLNLLEGFSRNKVLFITEGETDTVTLLQGGFQALGIPGSSLYNSKYNKYLTEFAIVAVVLDSDAAGDDFLQSIKEALGDDATRLFFVEMPKGIKDANELLCNKCYKDIARFKDEFKKLALVPATEEGFAVLLQAGGDIDLITTEYIGGYVKHIARGDEVAIDRMVHSLYTLQGKQEGIRKTSIKNIAMEALKDTAKALAETQEKVMEEADFIITKEKSYYYKKVSLAGISYEQFTNFTVTIDSLINDGSGEIKARWRLKTIDGLERVLVIGAEERASEQAFLKQLGALPGYSYVPSNIKGFHSRFVYYIEYGCTASLYTEANVIGRYKDKWLFEDYAIDSKGNVVLKEPTAIGYCLDNEDFLAPQEYIDDNNRYIKVALPLVDAPIPDEVIRDIADKTLKNYGNIIGMLSIGWTLACYMKGIIQEDLKWGFPVCYITGNSESGKSTLARNMLKFFGIYSPSVSADSSMFGINKLCSIYSGIPLWFDDIRDIGEQGIWNKIILASYENSNIVKGTKDMKLSDRIEYNAALLITSEFFMKSTAAGNRCIKLTANEHDQDRSYYKDLEPLINEWFPLIGMRALKYVQHNREKCKERLLAMEKMMVDLGYKDRMSRNYAVVITGIQLLVELDVKRFGKLWEKILLLTQEMVSEIKNSEFEHTYAITLLSDIANMMFNPAFKIEYKYNTEWTIQDNKIILFTENLYNLWIKYMNNGRPSELINRTEFTVQLRRLAFSIKPNDSYVKKWQGKTRRAVILDISKMLETDSPLLKQIVDVFTATAKEEQVQEQQDNEIL